MGLITVRSAALFTMSPFAIDLGEKSWPSLNIEI